MTLLVGKPHNVYTCNPMYTLLSVTNPILNYVRIVMCHAFVVVWKYRMHRGSSNYADLSP